MPVPAGKKKALYAYTDDFGTLWNTYLTAERASAGGYTAGNATYPRWRSSRNNRMRGLWCVSDDLEQKTFITFATTTAYHNAWNLGGFNLLIDEQATHMNVTGRQGEQVSVAILGT